jgi:ADP-ribose pyrophosphatase YjhB (NUDIX family)
MAPKFLPEELFIKSFKHVPRLAVCILLKNKQGDILLAKRTIPPFQGNWHYPGRFLLKDEKIENCLKRVAKDEFGVALDINKMRLLGIYENLKGDPRGHIVDVLYEYRLEKDISLTNTRENGEFQFFRTLPQKMAFNHKNTLKKIGYN